MYDEMKKEVKVSEHEYRYIGKHGTRADAADTETRLVYVELD